MAADPVTLPLLSAAEIAAIDSLGQRRSVAGGEYLYREGDAKYDFYVVVSGAVEIVVQADGAERLVARVGPGQFLAEVDPLSGQRGSVSAPARAPGGRIGWAARDGSWSAAGQRSATRSSPRFSPGARGF